MRGKYFLILILLAFLVFWIWWIPGLRVANDFSYVSRDFLKLQFDIPRLWNERGAEGLGEYGVFLLWSYPVNFIFGVLANLGLDFEAWERILVLLFIFLGSISIWKLLSIYRLSDKSKLIGSFFYLVNTYSILLIDGGQLSVALAYGLFPLAFLQTCKAIDSGLREKILAGLVITLLGFFDIRFLFTLFLVILLKALINILEQGRSDLLTVIGKWIYSGLVIAIIIIFLNAYWLIAYFKVPVNKDVIASFTKISASFLNIGHPLLVISPHWYENVFGKISQLHPEFILLPVLVILAPILRKKDKTVAFWLLVAIFSIFLAKGGSEPLSQIYPWLHANIPGFSFFRDSTKFFFPLVLSYSVLISIASEQLMKKVFKKRVAIIYCLLITAYLLYLIKPIFLNQMTGTFSIQPFEKEFQTLATVLKKDQTFGRVFWIPATVPLAYSDLNHPIVEAARVFNRTPFVYGVKGTYEIFNFLREAPYMGEIFDVAAVSYIAYPFLDSRRGNLSADDIRYYDSFLGQLSNLPWVEGKIARSEIPLLKTKNHQDKIFITGRTFAVFGSDEIFHEATKSANLKLAKNAIIFMEDRAGKGELISRYPEAKIVLNKKTTLDLLASFIPASQIIFPANKLNVSPNQSRWWKNNGTDLISWRDFLQTKYAIDNKDFDLGGGWAVGEGSLKLKVQSEKFRKGEVLLARVMENSRSGKIGFYQDDELIGSIDTFAKDTIVRWHEIGSLKKSSDLIIKTEGDINVVNALAVISLQDLLDYKNKADALAGQITQFKPESVVDGNALVVYQKINPTKYRISVSNLTSPEMLIFSSTFHPGWKLNGQVSLSVYGFLNGFRVDRDGEYILEFEPQKYVEEGLIISLFGFTSIILLLLYLKRKHS